MGWDPNPSNNKDSIPPGPKGEEPEKTSNWIEFEKQLETLINQHCIDNMLQTPDYLIANKVVSDLKQEAKFILEREKWHGREPKEARVCSQQHKA